MIRLLVFLLFMVSGTALFYLVFVHQLPKESDSGVLPQPTSDVTLATMHLQQNRGPKLEYELFADSAVYNEQARQALLTTVRFQVFQSNDDPPQPLDMRGSAERAFLDDPRQRILLQGKVHVTKDNDTEVDGDVVDYYIKEGRVKAQGNVRVRDKKSVVQGESLDYNVKGERIVVDKPVLFQ